MRDHHHSRKDADKLRLIDEAHASVEAHNRVMSEVGLTPAACLEGLRRTEGPAAVEQLQQQVAQVLRRFEERSAREVFNTLSGRRPVSRRLAGRRII